MRQTWLILLAYTHTNTLCLLFVIVTQNKLYFRINDCFSVYPETGKM